MAGKQQYPDSVIEDLIARRAEGQKFKSIASALNKQYGFELSEDAVQQLHARYKHLFDVKDEIAAVKNLRTSARVQRNNSLTAKDNRNLLQYMNNMEDIMESLASAASNLNTIKSPKIPKHKHAPKTKMTIEALLSDVHIGKKSKIYNIEIGRDRLTKYAQVLLGEIERKSAHYDVERIILAMLGDLIENALIHGRESTLGCEFGNPEQIRYAVELIWGLFILPLATTGIHIDVVAINGNHDREEPNKTYQLPGKNSLAWVIYQMLAALTKQAGIKNVTFTIPDGAYHVDTVYGNNILYEHGDHIRAYNRQGYLVHIAKRSRQEGKVITGLRHGHTHESLIMDSGVVVVNASVCGADSYSEVLGYDTGASQTITYYVQTENRSNSYYHSFQVQL